jgi:hypothetical protein
MMAPKKEGKQCCSTRIEIGIINLHNTDRGRDAMQCNNALLSILTPEVMI